MDLGQHAVFILGAYAFTAIVIAALIVGIVLDTHNQKRRLAALETQGIGRRFRQTSAQNS